MIRNQELDFQIFDSLPPDHTQTSPGMDAVIKPVLYMNPLLGLRGHLKYTSHSKWVGGHQDMIPFTCVKILFFNNCRLDVIHVNGVMSQ